jgi:hypothetical protein
MDQVQVKKVNLSADVTVVKAKVVPDQRRLGARLKRDRKKVVDALMTLSDKQVRGMLEKGEMYVEGHLLTSDDVSVKYVFEGGDKGMIADSSEEMVVVLDTNITPELQEEFFRKLAVNLLQRLRKSSGVRKSDDIELFYSSQGNKLDQFFKQNQKMISEATERPFLPLSQKPAWSTPLGTTSGKIDRVNVDFVVCPPCWCTAVPGVDEATQFGLDMSVGMRKRQEVTKEVAENDGFLTVKLNGVTYKLQEGVTLFSSSTHKANTQAEKK